MTSGDNTGGHLVNEAMGHADLHATGRWRTRALALSGVVTFAIASAHAQLSIECPSVTFRHDATMLATWPAATPGADVGLDTPAQSRAGADDANPEPATPPWRYGARDTTNLHILGLYGFDFDDAHQGGVGVAVSHFVADDFSIDLELLGWGFSQDGSNAAGGNVNVLVRWHCVQRDSWSWYLDGGAGLLFTSDDVPDDGKSFNFTPQLGTGLTWAISDDTRMMVGVRWHHISNGRLSSNNPGRDSVLVYAGISIPLR